MKAVCICPSCKAELMFDNAIDRIIKCPRCSHRGRMADFKEVPTKMLYCPNCASSFTYKLNQGHKTITCPKCKRTEVVGKYSQAPTNKNTNSTEEESTEHTAQTFVHSNKMYQPGKLMLKSDDGAWIDMGVVTIDLERGKNTLGRRHPNSSSSIQLPTRDSYMSKDHAIIEVVMRHDATFEHRLSDNRSKNGTFLNGIRLDSGDIFVLNHGDTLRMGHTALKFTRE